MNDISREVNIIDSIIKRVPYDGPVLSRVEEKLMELKAVIEQGGGGGTSDYDELENRPAVNGHTLTGDQTAAQLGLYTGMTVDTLYTGTSLADENAEHWNISTPITLAHPITDYKFVVIMFGSLPPDLYVLSTTIVPAGVTFPFNFGTSDENSARWYRFATASQIDAVIYGAYQMFIKGIYGVK